MKRQIELLAPFLEQVKAILKTWAPGVVEACSRADFTAAMGGLDGGERVSLQRVCEVAAAVLGSVGGVSENSYPSSAPVQRAGFRRVPPIYRVCCWGRRYRILESKMTSIMKAKCLSFILEAC